MVRLWRHASVVSDIQCIHTIRNNVASVFVSKIVSAPSMKDRLSMCLIPIKDTRSDFFLSILVLSVLKCINPDCLILIKWNKTNFFITGKLVHFNLEVKKSSFFKIR